MSDREQAAQDFAKAMGWTCHITPFAVYFTFLNNSKVPQVLALPDTEDFLAVHFEFVGRIADELECFYPTINVSDTNVDVWRVEFYTERENVGEADDPAWAALLAGIAAKLGGGR